MFENRLFINEQVVEYFNNLIEGFDYVLKVEDSATQLKEFKKFEKDIIKLDDLIIDFNKYYKSSLVSLTKSKSLLIDKDKKGIAKKFDELTNNAVDNLENQLRKILKLIKDSKEQVELKMHILNNLHAQLNSKFDEVKLVPSSKLV